MQSHPLDGDGLNVELFKLLGRVSKTSVASEVLPFRIPDTVVYSVCASFWYYFDESAGAVVKRPAKSLEKQTIFDAFSKRHKNDKGDVVAFFANTRSSVSALQIDYLTVSDLRQFLFGERKERHGILQKYIEGKTEHAELVQVVYSPSLTFAVRRQNRSKQFDRTLSTALRSCTFDGPAYQCNEYFSVSHSSQPLFEMCKAFVSFFGSVEPSFVIRRVACYFRIGSDDVTYLLFTTSVRIVERTDPELMELWGKRSIPFAAIKHALGGNQQQQQQQAGGGALALASTVQQQPIQAAQSGAVPPSPAQPGLVLTAPQAPYQLSMEVQPLSLVPTCGPSADSALLDKLTCVPTRQTNVFLLQLAKKRAPTKYRPVSKRLLSPFFTPGMEDTEVPEDICAYAAARQARAKRMDEKSMLLEAQNRELEVKLLALQRSAAELCFMNDLDRLPVAVSCEHVESEGSESEHSTSHRSSPSLRHAPTPSSVHIQDVPAEIPSTVDSPLSFGPDGVPRSHVQSFSVASDAQRGGSGSGRGRSSFIRGVAETTVKLGKRRRSKIGRGGLLSTPQGPFVPTEQVKLMARLVVASAAEAAAALRKTAPENAARLSDVFYPLAEVVSEHRRPADKYNNARVHRAYGEEIEDVIRVDHHTGEISVSFPTDLFLAARRMLGPYWATLRLLPHVDEASCMPSSPPASSTITTCTMTRPFQTASCFTFSPGKLEQFVAEDCKAIMDGGSRAAARVVTLQHRQLMDAIHGHQYHVLGTFQRSESITINAAPEEGQVSVAEKQVARKNLLSHLRAASLNPTAGSSSAIGSMLRVHSKGSNNNDRSPRMSPRSSRSPNKLSPSTSPRSTTSSKHGAVRSPTGQHSTRSPTTSPADSSVFPSGSHGTPPVGSQDKQQQPLSLVTLSDAENVDSIADATREMSVGDPTRPLRTTTTAQDDDDNAAGGGKPTINFTRSPSLASLLVQTPTNQFIPPDQDAGLASQSGSETLKQHVPVTIVTSGTGSTSAEGESLPGFLSPVRNTGLKTPAPPASGAGDDGDENPPWL